MPKLIKHWITDFLTDRKQRVKLSQDCQSEWRSVSAGVPQGTKLGPWLFLIMINELNTSADLWKFVDDISVSEIVQKGDDSKLQHAIDDLARQSIREGFQLSQPKCKELRIGFSKSAPNFDSIELNGEPLEIVTSAKLLGLNISSNLKWNNHISELVRKAAPRLYYLRQLKRSRIAPKDLLLFYTTCIRSTLEYACPVFHRALPEYLSDDLERIQRRALRIISPDLSYSKALETHGLQTLRERREMLTTKLFNNIVKDPRHNLHKLLPERRTHVYDLRNKRKFVAPLCQTDRFKKSFLMSQLYNF